MSHTSDWLDSVQEIGDDMPDSNSDRHLFKVLGSLGSDVKHSLSLLERSRQDTTQLRLDMKGDIHEMRTEFKTSLDKQSADHVQLQERVDKLETFQTKIMAWATILIPAAIIVGQALAPVVLGMLQ